MSNVPNPSDSRAPTAYARIAQDSAKPAKEGPHGIERIDVAFPMSYTWDYATSRLDLRVLYEKSKDLMWNGSTDLPWDTNVDPEGPYFPDTMSPLYGTHIWAKLERDKGIPNLRRHMASYMISNFLHGEQGALLATSQIVNCAPTSEAKFYAAAQVFDEARHVEVYDRYLREKYELVYPISPYLKQLLDTLLTDSRWDFKYLGMQILVEGVALGAFGFIHQMTNEPLIKQITHMIMQDESRHVAFGVLALKDTYQDMPANELRDREDFVIEGSRLLRDRFLGQEVYERLGLPQKECEELSERSEAMQFFRKLLFTKIVPNVKRLGLLTPYVRRGFEELGVIEYESWDPSA
ncbi:ferritin-like domain-containing protein [Pendulispora brunnea]|uniref:Ferritin-like domain-containing protein n=1 Tax=Pendulispora brunnea TaxID=2905690 RepID=A0ABZ2K8R9_9BACT